jgi:NDP-sugar pyrophosphorylase family protein
MSSSPPNAATRAGELASVDVAVLAGGLGTRLRSVLGATPKILAPVAGRPFIDHLFTWLKGFGARRIVLCLGVGATAVLDHLAAHPASGLEIVPSIETEPLGTAGALRLAVPHLTSDPVLVMNGDTFVDADLNAAVRWHHQSSAAATILCVSVPSTARYGRLDIDSSSFIRRFAEKDPADTGPGAINAGIYLLSQAWLRNFAKGSGPSLERDAFAAAAPGTFGAFIAPEAAFIDIGTPESFAESSGVLTRALARRGTLPAGAA